jgi:hypothetical protein
VPGGAGGCSCAEHCCGLPQVLLLLLLLLLLVGASCSPGSGMSQAKALP